MRHMIAVAAVMCGIVISVPARAQKPTYDRLTDSTSWTVGRTADFLIFLAPGETPSCATTAVVLFETEAVNYGGLLESVNAELQTPGPRVLAAIVDGQRSRVEGIATQRPAKLGEGNFVAQWRYIIPDSMVSAVRNASDLEFRDDLGHQLHWSAAKIQKAPPVCQRTGSE